MPLQFLSKVWFCVPDTNIKQPVPVTEDQECIWITSIASAGNIIPAFAKYAAERLGYIIVGIPMTLIFTITYWIDFGINKLYAL